MFQQLLDDLIYYHSTIELKNSLDYLMFSHKKEKDIIVIGNNYKVFQISRCQTIVDVDKYQTNLVKIKKKARRNSNRKLSGNCWFCSNKTKCGVRTDINCCTGCFKYCEFDRVESNYPLFLDDEWDDESEMSPRCINYFLNNKVLLLSYKYEDNSYITLKFEYMEKVMNCPIKDIFGHSALVTGRCTCKTTVPCIHIIKFRLSKIFVPLIMCINNIEDIVFDISLLIKYRLIEIL